MLDKKPNSYEELRKQNRMSADNKSLPVSKPYPTPPLPKQTTPPGNNNLSDYLISAANLLMMFRTSSGL